ncbi:hypothetical protein Zmor_010746 [Zophobas morio]|uniref:Uncharacterized protein n=1 Tax=Zophobas morio TaxID=2755281 RepID=A0AA38IS11_9CUCU|nr:hypothetical protein Zmor_010746 [Zophobas morio]
MKKKRLVKTIWVHLSPTSPVPQTPECAFLLVIIDDTQRSSDEDKADSIFDDNLDEAMLAAVDTFEAIQERRRIANEHYRLVDEIMLPLTKSGSKFISFGVRPFKNFEPVVKIHKPQLTAAVIFDDEEYDDFVKKLGRKIAEIRSVDYTGNADVFSTRRHNVTFQLKEKVFKISCSEEDVHKPLYFKNDTLLKIHKHKAYFQSLLSKRISARRPIYDIFLNDVALHVMENNNANIEESLLDVISKGYAEDWNLNEMCMKTPHALIYHVNKRIKYFRDHNEYY